MQSWVEIPEKYDEMWNRRTTSARQTNAANIRMPNLDWRAGLENLRRRKAEREADKQEGEINEEAYVKQNKSNNDDHVVDIQEEKNEDETEVETQERNIKDSSGALRKISILNKLIKVASNNNISKNDNEKQERAKCSSMYDNVESKQLVGMTTTADESSYKSGEEFRETTESTGKNEAVSSEQLYSDDPNLNEQIRLKDLKETANKRRGSLWKSKIPSIKAKKEATILKPVSSDTEVTNENGTKETKFKKVEKQESSKLGDVVRLAQTVNQFTKNTKKVQNRRKFNYEKYIKYLELTMDTVGFSLGKVTITWDRVSFFIVLLMTLVGVFAQNAFLK